MNRYRMIMIAATLTSACALQAQNPLSTELKQAYTGVKSNLMKAAEKISDDDYNFKATPDVRTIGELIAHIADAQTRNCSAVNGAAKSGGAASKKSKADLVAALKQSFAECDTAYDSLTDASAVQMIKTARGERSKLGTLYGNAIHDNEEYGYLAVYMRLKSVVPPSSEKR